MFLFPGYNNIFSVPQELDESFNYGLFLPPVNGRAGKFLDEERRLSEYPFQGSVGTLEVNFNAPLGLSG